MGDLEAPRRGRPPKEKPVEPAHVIDIPVGLRDSAISLPGLPYWLQSRIESCVGRYQVTPAGILRDDTGNLWSLSVESERVSLMPA